LSSSRSRTIQLGVLAVLLYATLRPGTAVDRWIEEALVPARVLAELARPVTWLGGQTVLAAPERQELWRRSRELLEREGAAALPRDGNLAAGRGFVHGQTIERPARDPDGVVIQYDPRCTLAPGMYVTSGDHYLGRVESLVPERPGEAVVRLITGREARIGAEVLLADGSRAPLVVGGVALHPDPRDTRLYLAVHAPSRGDLTAGPVRVRASLDPGQPGLADGFLLGELVHHEQGGLRFLAVRAGFDYDAGPYELVIVSAPEHALAGGSLAREPFAPERWRPTRFAARGTPSALREARVLSHGRSRGLERGAALASDGVLVGRLTRVLQWSARAELVGDPGFAVAGLAQLEDQEEPLVLGRLVSLGRDGEALLFRWENTQDPPLAAGAAGAPGIDLARAPRVRAFVVSGWGERGLPAGLVLGTTELVRARGPQVLRITPPLDVRALERVEVWRANLPPEPTP